MKTETIPTDTADFLEALLFAYPGDDDCENLMEGKSIYDFSTDFVDAATGFIDAFRAYCDAREIEIPESERSFGGNVYFSLSGHGCGFRDDDETEHLQTALDAFSGDHYRFEGIDLFENPDTGELDLSFIPSAIGEYRSKMFTPAIP